MQGDVAQATLAAVVHLRNAFHRLRFAAGPVDDQQPPGFLRHQQPPVRQEGHGPWLVEFRDCLGGKRSRRVCIRARAEEKGGQADKDSRHCRHRYWHRGYKCSIEE